MSIQYSGGTIVNYTFTDAGTRIDLVNNLNTQLKNAGWSVISGDGTSDVLMKSAVTPQGLSVRFRLFDPGSGNCAQFSMKNNAGTLTSGAGFLLPGSVQWRIWANKYWFAMFRTTAINRKVNRAILFGGTLVGLPSSVITLLAGDLDVGWINYSGTSDTDVSTANQHTWRSETESPATNNTVASFLWRSVMNASSGTWPTFARSIMYVFNNSVSKPNWVDGQSSCEIRDAQLAIAALGGYVGFISDALIIGTALNGETDLFAFDSHTWMPITDQYGVTLAVLNS